MSKKFFVWLGLVGIALAIISSPAAVQSVRAESVEKQTRPIQLALFTPIQIVPEEEAIAGIRLSIYGRNTSVTGLDIGFVNHTTTGKSVGFQYGLVGIVEKDFTGWQFHKFANLVHGDFEGFQLGFFNYAEYASGLQLGIVNYAGRLKGLQIGLVNIIRQEGAFPVFPIVNWSF